MPTINFAGAIPGPPVTWRIPPHIPADVLPLQSRGLPVLWLRSGQQMITRARKPLPGFRKLTRVREWLHWHLIGLEASLMSFETGRREFRR